MQRDRAEDHQSCGVIKYRGITSNWKLDSQNREKWKRIGGIFVLQSNNVVDNDDQSNNVVVVVVGGGGGGGAAAAAAVFFRMQIHLLPFIVHLKEVN